MYCRSCGKAMDPQHFVCTQCGAPKGKGNAFCPSCGKSVHEMDSNCSSCGQPLVGDFNQAGNQQQQQRQQYYQNNQQYSQRPQGEAKSRLVAGLLGIFLGGYGIHNFYLGYTNKAIGQLVLTICTCGIGSLWGFIEGILILCNTSITTDANGVPLKD